MELYHFSNGYYKTLTPQFGENRNNSEDSRVSGKPCIWFTNKKRMVNGSEYSFCYVVDVDETDPDLIEDETVNDLMRQSGGDMKWYAYTKEIEPKEIYRKNNGIFEPINRIMEKNL